jgi:hypothetical protein
VGLSVQGDRRRSAGRSIGSIRLAVAILRPKAVGRRDAVAIASGLSKAGGR